MQIVELRAVDVGFPVISPQKMGVGELSDVCTNVFVCLRGSSGLVGFGEVPIWNVIVEYEIAAVLQQLRDVVAPCIYGHEPEELLGSTVLPAQIYPSVRMAVEMAAVDLIGKQNGIPAHVFFGPPVRPAMELSYSVSAQEFYVERAQIAECVKEGYRIFKLKVGLQAPAEDLARIKLYKSLHSDCEFRVDFNGIACCETFEELLTGLLELGVRHVEQPFHPGADDILRKFPQTTFVADESVKRLADIARLHDLSVYSEVSLKLAKVGGFGAATEMLKWSAHNGVQGYAGGMSESVLGVTAAVQYFCTQKNLKSGCDFYFPYKIIASQGIEGGCEVRDGRLWLSNKPGIGAECPREWFNL